MRLLLDTHVFIWWDSEPSLTRDAQFGGYSIAVEW